MIGKCSKNRPIKLKFFKRISQMSPSSNRRMLNILQSLENRLVQAQTAPLQQQIVYLKIECKILKSLINKNKNSLTILDTAQIALAKQRKIETLNKIIRFYLRSNKLIQQNLIKEKQKGKFENSRQLDNLNKYIQVLDQSIAVEKKIIAQLQQLNQKMAADFKINTEAKPTTALKLSYKGITRQSSKKKL